MAPRRSLLEETLLSNTREFRDRLERGGLDYLLRGPANTTMNFDNENILFQKKETSFSGTDCRVIITYNQDMLILGNLETFSYSTFREKNPVRTLGYIYPKDYTRGSRTIGGSMVFVTFDEHPLFPLFKYFDKNQANTNRFSSPMSDEIPPFDMTLWFENEYGASAIMRLYGVELFQEGGVFSIQDIYSENTIQYIARDMDPLVSGSQENSWKKLLYNKMLEGRVIDTHFASMLKYKANLENQYGSIEQQIQKIMQDYGLWTGGFTGTLRGTSVNAAKRGEKEAAKEKIKSLRKQQENIKHEISHVSNVIETYERRRMTWDMNANLTGVDSSVLSERKSTNETGPTPTHSINSKQIEDGSSPVFV